MVKAIALRVRFNAQRAKPRLIVDYVMFPCSCNYFDIQVWRVVGDPTEGALYVLAQKGGVDVKAFRQNYPRNHFGPFSPI